MEATTVIVSSLLFTSCPKHISIEHTQSMPVSYYCTYYRWLHVYDVYYHTYSNLCFPRIFTYFLRFSEVTKYTLVDTAYAVHYQYGFSFHICTPFLSIHPLLHSPSPQHTFTLHSPSPQHTFTLHSLFFIHPHTPITLSSTHTHTPLPLPSTHLHTSLTLSSTHPHTSLTLPLTHSHTPLTLPSTHPHAGTTLHIVYGTMEIAGSL